MGKPSVRDEILFAGLKTLHARGFNATSVQDITQAAGVPKGSFYNHFASKEDLGAAVVEQYSAKAAARWAILRDVSLAPLLRLRRYFETLIAAGRYPDTPGCLLGNFGAELSDQSPVIRERVSSALADWSDAIAHVIDEAQRDGAVPRDHAPEALATFVINAWEGSVLRAKVEGHRGALDTFLAIVFSKILA